MKSVAKLDRATASLDRAGTEREVLRLRLDPTDDTAGLEAGPNEQR
jgi:hypothetical protein